MSNQEFRCPQCNQILDIPEDLLGQIVQCASCGTEFTVPEPAVIPNAHPVQPASPSPTPSRSPEVIYDSCACPLCGDTGRMNKPEILYGHQVCRKCYYSFANRRQLAFIIDAVLWRIFVFPIAFSIAVILGLFGLSDTDLKIAATLFDCVMLPLIFICKDCFSGFSPGKFLCGVRVIDEVTGEPAGITASFKRNLPLLIPFMPIVVAFQLSKGHRIGDGWSNSRVIRIKYASNPVFLINS
ncbi:MAG: RDD family protein [Candidatus Wallbacteria bacterium]|nr:RDD family protein [Candidatus Wallbacteria bacterium]